MDKGAKDRIRQNGLRTVLNNYTWTSQILTTLAAVEPEVQMVVDEVRASLVQETLARIKPTN